MSLIVGMCGSKWILFLSYLKSRSFAPLSFSLFERIENNKFENDRNKRSGRRVECSLYWLQTYINGWSGFANVVLNIFADYQ